MTTLKLVAKTIKHYPWSAIATSAGIAIAASIIIGALVIGHSLSKSLEQIVYYRLGDVTHTITAGERLFSQQLAHRLGGIDDLSSASVLKSEAMLSDQQSGARVNKVQIWGVDDSFAGAVGQGTDSFKNPDDAIIISQNLAQRLKVEAGDFVLLRIRAINPIPSIPPFVSDEGQTVTRRVAISRIITKEEFSHFNLQTSQTAPYNIFVGINWLNRIMQLEDKANMIVLNASDDQGQLKEQLAQSINLHDLGLVLSKHGDTNHWKLTAERVFLDGVISDAITEHFPKAQSYLTYFANSLEHDNKETPYSFVTSTNRLDQIRNNNDMVVNQWLADDLDLTVGDSILMRYFVVGPLRELNEEHEWFQVCHILPMDLAVRDSILMPRLPGLSDAGSCSDWDTGIPIDLEKIRQKDEDYWDLYKGTPKAYISLQKGQQLWQNRFGDLTTVLFPGHLIDEQTLQDQLTRHVDPFRLEYQINSVREQGLEAAGNGVDFGQLFAGLGMFIIISGLLLTVLLLQYNLQKRQNQIRLFASLGFSQQLIHRIVMGEAALIIVLGSLVGLAISLAYTRLVFAGLNRIWYDIVRTDVLELHFETLTLLYGLAASILLGLLVVYLGTGKIIRQNIQTIGATKTKSHQGRQAGLIGWGALAFFTLFLVALAYTLFFNEGAALFSWLLAGVMLLVAILTGAYYGLLVSQKAGSANLSIYLLGWKNLTRNPARSFIIIVLLALGSFVIVVTAANQKDMVIDPNDRTGGTGGFDFIAETTVPVLLNLNETVIKDELGLPSGINVVQFHTSYDDDASCHNLNRVANPRILGAPVELLSGRFSFAATHALLDKQNPWKSLEKNYDGFIPAIADQSVIQWGLGKAVGDTLYYLNADGQEIRVLLIGGLANSVLQGNVVISASQLLENFPSNGGSSVFLIDAKSEETNTMRDELEFVFRDYGWEMTPTPIKLAEFNSVENTYLQIFFLLGALGMLLGTIGLAVIIAKSLLERSNETAMLKALGYRSKYIFMIYVFEYALLLITGLLAGTISGLIATMPSFLIGSQNVAPGFLITVLAVITINGLLWIVGISWGMIRSKKSGQLSVLQNGYS